MKYRVLLEKIILVDDKSLKDFVTKHVRGFLDIAKSVHVTSAGEDYSSPVMEGFRVPEDLGIEGARYKYPDSSPQNKTKKRSAKNIGKNSAEPWRERIPSLRGEMWYLLWLRMMKHRMKRIRISMRIRLGIMRWKNLRVNRRAA
jgi:hypothetical protein